MNGYVKTFCFLILGTILCSAAFAEKEQTDKKQEQVEEKAKLEIEKPTIVEEPKLQIGSSYDEKLKYWESLTEEQRLKLRQQAQQLDQQKMKDLKKRAGQFRDLPPEQRRKLRDMHMRFQDLPPHEREKMRQQIAERMRHRQGPMRPGMQPRPNRPQGMGSMQQRPGMEGRNQRHMRPNPDGNPPGGTTWRFRNNFQNRWNPQRNSLPPRGSENTKNQEVKPIDPEVLKRMEERAKKQRENL